MTDGAGSAGFGRESALQGPIWHIRDESAGRIVAYAGGPYADGTRLARPPDGLTGVVQLLEATFEPATRTLRQVTVAGPVPHLWYVTRAEPRAEPPAMNLIAFATSHFPSGRVIDDVTFTPLPIRSEEQVGAIRWWPQTGQIHQIYVQPVHRRQGIGRALVHVAGACIVAEGSSARIWASGDRTELGEALTGGMPVGARVRPRRSVLPPMTPEADATGVPARNLHPAR